MKRIRRRLAMRRLDRLTRGWPVRGRTIFSGNVQVTETVYDESVDWQDLPGYWPCRSCGQPFRTIRELGQHHEESGCP